MAFQLHLLREYVSKYTFEVVQYLTRVCTVYFLLNLQSNLSLRFIMNNTVWCPKGILLTKDCIATSDANEKKTLTWCIKSPYRKNECVKIIKIQNLILVFSTDLFLPASAFQYIDSRCHRLSSVLSRRKSSATACPRF